MKHTKRTIALTAFVLVLGASVAMAEDAPKERRLAPCKDDIAKFCADVPRGQHKTRPCLETNKDKLTPECKVALETPKKTDGK